jgi:transcriptional regulator with XRE-family HTH domain
VNFGEKVRQLRAERNLTQPQLAQAIGIEQSYLSKLENDKSVPSADIFQSILKAFAIDVATFLEGMDEKQVYRDLRQIPEVANHLNTQATTKIHSIKAWLYVSGVALALGLTLVVAGYRGLIYTSTQYNYESPGVLLPGEPSNFFQTFPFSVVPSGLSKKQAFERAQEVSKRQVSDYQRLDEYRGSSYTVDVPGGQRTYFFHHPSTYERPENRWLMLAGTLFTVGGLVGFIIEARLRRVRL